jgi:hypothetical protein
MRLCAPGTGAGPYPKGRCRLRPGGRTGAGIELSYEVLLIDFPGPHGMTIRRNGPATREGAYPETALSLHSASEGPLSFADKRLVQHDGTGTPRTPTPVCRALRKTRNRGASAGVRVGATVRPDRSKGCNGQSISSCPGVPGLSRANGAADPLLNSCGSMYLGMGGLPSSGTGRRTGWKAVRDAITGAGSYLR